MQRMKSRSKWSSANFSLPKKQPVHCGKLYRRGNCPSVDKLFPEAQTIIRDQSLHMIMR